MENGFLQEGFLKLDTTFPILVCQSYCEFDIFVNYFPVVDNPLWQALQNVLFRQKTDLQEHAEDTSHTVKNTTSLEACILGSYIG